MDVSYYSDERVLNVVVDEGELDSTERGGVLSDVLYDNSPLHERRVSLGYDADKKSQFASVFSERGDIVIRIGPRNFVDLSTGRTVNGVYKEGKLEIKVSVSCN